VIQEGRERDRPRAPDWRPSDPSASEREAGAGRRGLALPFALLAGFLFAAAAAHAPWVRAGLTSGEYAELLDPARGGAWFARLTLAWQRASGAVSAPGVAPVLLRIETLVALGLFVFGMASFLKRALAPWCGAERARTVGRLFAFLFLLHPLLVDSAAPLAARPGRLALACAGVGLALFLSGRQEGREGRTASALGAFFVAGLFSADTLPLVLLLALAEYTSSHRHRPRSLRRRTALTTLGLFGAVHLLAPLWSGAAGSLLREVAPRELLLACSTELGRLCIPVAGSAGAVILAGALLPLLFHPLFHAARVAPRLWGGLVLAWSVFLAGALLWWAAAGSADAPARELLALAALCAGLALAASARDARRTVVLALLAGLILTPLAQAAARPWLAAARATQGLAAELSRRVPPGRETVLLLDPPGADLPGQVTTHLGWLLHPALGTLATEELPFEPRRVRGIAREALLHLARAPVAAEVLGPRVLVLHDERVVALSTAPPPGLASGRKAWRTELGYAFENGLDPRALEAVEVVAELETRPDELQRLAWRTRDGATGEVQGSTSEERGRRVARYDLLASLDWLLAGEVRALSLPGGRRSIERGELVERWPEPAGSSEPLRVGRDWLFRLDLAAEVDSATLLLLELEGLRSVLLPAVRDSGGLRVADAAHLPVPTRRLWVLELRSAGQLFARRAGVTDPNGELP